MNQVVKESLWKQFGASLDMLENALIACPDALWDTETKFWHIAYHTLFFLDYYLSDEPLSFSPPAPFTMAEFEGRLPERVYSKEELLDYLQHGRQKCRTLIAGLTEAGALKRFVDDIADDPTIEIILYNLRHVQHHVGQLNLLLRQGTNDAPEWVGQAGEGL
ncbi:MAG TPA: DinB family protein [Saprospiraceae bacterium]|nr:DinB family protein [Saprospiraceae bacterium]HMQ82973.1 DinB family protein [Saprospiraceae bacterium]